MTAPTLRFFNLTSPGSSSYYNVLSRFNTTNGPAGTQVGPGAAAGNERWDFANIQASSWGQPKVLIFQYDDNTVTDVRFRLYDHISGLEDFYDGVGGDWDFRIKLLKDYTDPAAVSEGTILTWPTMPHGVSTLGYSIDSNRPNPGNDGTAGLLVPHATVANRYILNCYVYVSFKPASNAVAGNHIDWGFRSTHVYPNTG
jgi:hypothetical protein